MNTKMNILIVDDDHYFHRFLKDQSKHEDWNISLISDARDIKTKITEINPDIIVMDLVLPFLDGLETLNIIRKDNTLRRIPVFIVSRLDDLLKFQESISKGADGFYLKTDFKPYEVIQEIAKKSKVNKKI